MKKYLFLFFFLLFSLSAEVINLIPSVSGVLQDVDLDGNFDIVFIVDLIDSQESAGLENRAVFEYDISSIVPGSIINSATVNINETSDPVFGNTNLFGYAGDGVIDVGDAVRTDAFIGNIANGTVDLQITDVTAFIQSLVDNNDPFASFVVDNENLDVIYQFQGTTAGLETELVIDFTAPAVPEPSTYILLLILSIFCFRSRFKNNKTNK
ncbi:PEP-CTERM sorting domain-containing protein [Candidatus Uabimicrobium amorphum]|uniref:PEP-CTERM protein-sorting domain-containing protein n=1 Tax=Uabimicrobium amorphum TaxID=2596890 RepID=A0A5S9ISI6_UABAM|nr:PEP-CTERM sorting domain-containing protein [Candidatus Uabimicrobium amorphum]BBM86621.1 hypothetical protein UABAM_05007 [Candidatus Uabimicrobium amorphum]